MKLIAGSLLIVASAILFLARIQAEQPMNGEWFNGAIQLATRCGLVLCVLGSAFIAWGLGGGVSKVGKGQERERHELEVEGFRGSTATRGPIALVWEIAACH